MTKPPRQNPPRLLIADDQKDVLEALHLMFKGEGFEVERAGAPGQVLELLRLRDFDVLLMDLNYARDTTSGKEGLDLLAQVRALDNTLPVVVMTAWGSVELAVEAMRRGARDFVQKPWENERLLAIIRNQIELGRALRKGEQLEAENQMLREQGRPSMIANARAMQPVLELIERVGPSDANVLVTGENGTGKGVVARALHVVSTRSNRPFVVVNMGGFAEGLFESELFGHVKGAFTDAKADRQGRFELADGGTLFLDEIANLSRPQQTRLLRVLETGEFERVGSSKTLRADVRIISATNADLRTEVAAARFRQDLLFRLNTIEIHLPPLRERREDIRPLAENFLRQRAQHYRKQVAGFDAPALQALENQAWPGNVRELQHVVERAALTKFMEDYSRLAKLPAPRLQPVALEPLLHRVIGLENRLTVKLHVGPDLRLRADAVQVEQLLINLLRNAVDAVLGPQPAPALTTAATATNAPGVMLSWKRVGHEVELRVEDDGPGISNPANLFVPFFTTKPGGSGIGLVLSRQIAEAHGGSLTLENRASRTGCVARLRLPIHPEPGGEARSR